MSVSNTIKALLYMKEKKQTELASHFGMNPQSMANKMSRESFSAKDLIKIAEFTGCRLAFVMDDGQNLYLDPAKEEDAK